MPPAMVNEVARQTKTFLPIKLQPRRGVPPLHVCRHIRKQPRGLSHRCFQSDKSLKITPTPRSTVEIMKT